MKVKGMNTQWGGSAGGYRKLTEKQQRWHGMAEHSRYWVVAIGKVRSPKVDSNVWWRGRDNVDADRRWDLMPRSVGQKSSSTRYVDAVPLQHLKAIERQACTEYVLELSANVADVVKIPWWKHQLCSRVYHWLKPLSWYNWMPAATG